jgi:hypothetical protein
MAQWSKRLDAARFRRSRSSLLVVSCPGNFLAASFLTLMLALPALFEICYRVVSNPLAVAQLASMSV